MNFQLSFKIIFQNFILKMLIYVLALLPALADAATADSLSVFYPSTIASSVRQKTLSESNIGFKNILVFAKYKEFENYHKKFPAQFIIVPDSYLEFHSDYNCTHQFTLNNEKTFRFHLLSLDKSWDQSKTESGVLGVVDELGRRDMRKYVDKLLNGMKFKQVTRVSNLEDLIVLLALENANYILISPWHYNELKDRYQLNTYKVFETALVRHPLLCSKPDSKFNPANFNKQLINSLGYTGVAEIK